MFKHYIMLLVCVFNFFLFQAVLEKAVEVGFSNEHPMLYLLSHSVFFIIVFLAYKVSVNIEKEQFKEIKG